MDNVIRSTDSSVRKILTQKDVKLFPKNPLYSVLDDGAWSGQRCYIIGGGASLNGFDFDKLFGERIIAVNVAFLDVPFADICFFMDALQFYKWIMAEKIKDDSRSLSAKEVKKRFLEFTGYRVLLDLQMSRDFNGIHTLFSNGSMKYGFPTSMRDGLYHGNNSGYGALQLAITLGANPICLLGFDMHHTKTQAETLPHYHRRYPITQREAVLESFIHGFKHLARECKKKKIRIINMNRRSRLKCFEFGDLENIDALRATENDDLKSTQGTAL